MNNTDDIKNKFDIYNVNQMRRPFANLLKSGSYQKLAKNVLSNFKKKLSTPMQFPPDRKSHRIINSSKKRNEVVYYSRENSVDFEGNNVSLNFKENLCYMCKKLISGNYFYYKD